MTVQYCHRAELLQVRQRLSAIFRAPTPLRIDGPKRNVCEYHDGRAVLQLFHVVFQPFELLVAQRSEPTGFQIHDVDQPDEVRTLLIEAVPSPALTSFSIALQELF